MKGAGEVVHLLGWGKEKEASSSLEGDSAQTRTGLPVQPCVVRLRRERAQPKGATVCLREGFMQCRQGAELTLMGKWEVRVISGPEMEGGKCKDKLRDKQQESS